jgi:hypothetical protein
MKTGNEQRQSTAKIGQPSFCLGVDHKRMHKTSFGSISSAQLAQTDVKGKFTLWWWDLSVSVCCNFRRICGWNLVSNRDELDSFVDVFAEFVE